MRRAAALAVRVAIAACVAAPLVPRAALAQSPDDLARARALFREGVALSAANNWAAALAKFKAVAQVKMTAQVAFNIAECEEKLGKLVSALGNYRIAASTASETNAKDVSSQVDARIAALEQRIPKLSIVRGANAETATIELDGVELGSTQIGAEIPVDPGPHVVVAKAADREPSRQTVTIAEREAKTVSVDLSAPGASPSGSAREQPPDEGAAEKPEGGHRSIVPGVVVTSVGAASLVAGVVFIALRQGTISDLDAQCDGTSCPPTAESTANRGRLYTGLAEATIALGVVGVATGVVLIATSSHSKSNAAPAANARAGLAPGSRASRWSAPRVELVAGAPQATSGLSLRGRF